MKRQFLLTTLIAVIISVAVNGRAATNIVNMTGNTFSPATLSIAKGDTVKWVNLDFVNHDTVGGGPTCGVTNGVWASSQFGHNGTFSFTFQNSGTYPYYCNPHCSVGMKGTITVTNAANAAPSVTITNPVNGAILPANTSFTIGATASDSDGTVTNVAFLVGTNFIANDTTSPYSATTNLGAGTYTLFAVATDNGGSKTTNSISITINAAPTISLSAPAPYTVNENSSITFNVIGTDTDSLTVSATNLPPGATFTGTGNTRTFSWTPQYGRSYASPYVVSFSADDGINTPATTNASIAVTAVLTPITLSNVVRAGNQLQFQVGGIRVTRTNIIQATTNLPSWAPINTNIATNTSFTFIDTNAVQTKFYRVIEAR